VKGCKRYSLLVVRGDGARVLRFNFPRPAAVGAFVVVAVAISLVGALVGDWAQLRQLTREAKMFSQQLAEVRGDPGELMPDILESLSGAPPIPLITCAFACVSLDARSAALYAAIEPVTPRMMRLFERMDIYHHYTSLYNAPALSTTAIIE